MITRPRLTDRIFAAGALRVQADGRLVALAREGSEAAIEEIVRRYRPALLRHAASIVPADRADDVVQDSLARALPGIRSGESDLHLRPWLYTIVHNTALNNLRDTGPPHEHLDESYDGVEQPPGTIERRERLRSLIAGLRGLPSPQREALVKREMGGLSHAEIGAEMGISTGAARQLIFRAREALRTGVGLLVPMPVLRQLLEGGDSGNATAAAAAGGGGAVAIKALAAVLTTGVAVTAGVIVKDSQRDTASPPAIAAQLPGSGAHAASGLRGTGATPPGGGGDRPGGQGGAATGQRGQRSGAHPVGSAAGLSQSTVSVHQGGSRGQAPGASGEPGHQALGAPDLGGTARPQGGNTRESPQSQGSGHSGEGPAASRESPAPTGQPRTGETGSPNASGKGGESPGDPSSSASGSDPASGGDPGSSRQSEGSDARVSSLPADN